MRRRTRKLVVTLLLSVALLSMNMNFVYAEEISISDAVLSSGAQTSDTDASSDNGTVDSRSETQQTNGIAEEADNSSTTEKTTDNSAADASGTETETGENKEAAETGENSLTGTENEEQEISQDGTGSVDSATEDTLAGDSATGDAPAGDSVTGDASMGDSVTGDETEADDTAAADTTEGETPEKVYINENGEEIVPSTLVGVDYDTIADSYDGVTTVVKRYETSDTEAANTIMDSYVDEDGNLVMVISQGAEVKEAETKEEEKEENFGFFSEIAAVFALDSEMGGSGDAPAVDGSFTGWDDIPASYEFNWNKPDAWVDGVHYTETNSTDVRHEMKLYSDGENVYLKVVFAREFANGQIGNGNDYQFWIDDQQMAAYQVEWPDGSSLSYNTAEPGVYAVDVRHRDSSWSYVLTDGAVAYYHINEGNLNNELELKIPLSEFVKQNPDINLDNYSMISFFTPNLMQGKINAAGASTGAEPFAAAVFLLVPASYVWLKRKDDKEDMAFA